MPDLDRGRYAAKNAISTPFVIESVILCHGHEMLKADILYRHESEKDWRRIPMIPLGNDIYQGTFTPDKLGFYFYTVEASIDRFTGWREGFLKKIDAGEAESVDAEYGIEIVRTLLGESKSVELICQKIAKIKTREEGESILKAPELEQAVRKNWSDPSRIQFEHELPLMVDPPYAAFSAWYEFFPRSQWKDYALQGNLKDTATRLQYVSDLGFDVVYFPPIHPIGDKFRKGKNNAVNSAPGEVGSPWAIGNREGGHKSIHPDLGTFEDFDALVNKAKKLNLEIALDIAFQCSPDHPYVIEHPEWFKKRSDGSIQYAENPPKKYQDIYPFDFECEAWESLWHELKSIILFWIEKGVRIFRVDNPHTKSFPFWEWAIREIRIKHPDVIFLSEAFTRPHIMAYLAKIGFNQSYTYFTWRHTKEDFIRYMHELTRTELKYYFRPNFWPNTPDILAADLQRGGSAVFAQRLILAATLSSNYGIYGPAYELLEDTPVAQGKEEYLDSEKYEIREWDIDAPYTIAPFIRRINAIRRENPALHANDSLSFHPVANDNLIAYTKRKGENLVLIIVNLDTQNRHGGILDLQIHEFGLGPEEPYHLEDLLNGARYTWSGWKNYVELDPATPAHIFRITVKGKFHGPPAEVCHE